MRAGAIAIPTLALALAGLAGCKLYDNEVTAPAGWDWDAQSHEVPPSRTVHDDGGVVGAGGAGGGAGTGGGAGGSPGGGGAGGAVVPRDAGVDQGTSPAVDSGLPDLAEREAGDNTCDLLVPTCGGGLGYYPVAGGRGRCLTPDPGTPMGTQCFDPANCAPGLSCVDNTCVALCALDRPGTCLGGARCITYASYAGVGYCLP